MPPINGIRSSNSTSDYRNYPAGASLRSLGHSTSNSLTKTLKVCFMKSCTTSCTELGVDVLSRSVSGTHAVQRWCAARSRPRTCRRCCSRENGRARASQARMFPPADSSSSGSGSSPSHCRTCGTVSRRRLASAQSCARNNRAGSARRAGQDQTQVRAGQRVLTSYPGRPRPQTHSPRRTHCAHRGRRSRYHDPSCASPCSLPSPCKGCSCTQACQGCQPSLFFRTMYCSR